MKFIYFLKKGEEVVDTEIYEFETQLDSVKFFEDTGTRLEEGYTQEIIDFDPTDQDHVNLLHNEDVTANSSPTVSKNILNLGFDPEDYDSIKQWYSKLRSLDATHLEGLMIGARKLSCLYSEYINAEADAAGLYNTYHVKRRLDVADEAQRLMMLAIPTSEKRITNAEATRRAELMYRKIYAQEYESDTLQKKFLALSKGVDKILNRMNQDIARVRKLSEKH